MFVRISPELVYRYYSYCPGVEVMDEIRYASTLLVEFEELLVSCMSVIESRTLPILKDYFQTTDHPEPCLIQKERAN
ncbi:hypothetical protein RRG08_063408 [Elysia crispata]|uniref:Uncharacterized protein n=1 Tax=Elysia crispata TaxID=231223 RepID=A0AAE1AB25_9GAST|nr:hypothetical protein RRG08_063408 [Elysia crispata]